MPATKTPAPCGTYQARRRHKYHGETCETCEATARQLAPCGTAPARRRHAARGETCETCGPLGPKSVAAPCGTPAAAKRHHRKNEPVDEACEQALREHNAARYRKRVGGEVKPYASRASNGMSSEDLLAEIEWLLNAGEGEARILEATRYTHDPLALRNRLWGLSRADLVAQIFTPWDIAA